MDYKKCDHCGFVVYVDPTYTNGTCTECGQVTTFLCHFLSSLNCITDSFISDSFTVLINRKNLQDMVDFSSPFLWSNPSVVKKGGYDKWR